MKKYLFLMFFVCSQVVGQTTYIVSNAEAVSVSYPGGRYSVPLVGSNYLDNTFTIGESSYYCDYYGSVTVCFYHIIRYDGEKWVIGAAYLYYLNQCHGTCNLTIAYTQQVFNIGYYNNSTSSTPPVSGWLKESDGSPTNVMVTPIAPPCPSTLNYQNPTDNFASTPNPSLKKASVSITATNQIIGNGTTVSYQAGNKVELNAGFKADNGTVFISQIGGCN